MILGINDAVRAAKKAGRSVSSLGPKDVLNAMRAAGAVDREFAHIFSFFDVFLRFWAAVREPKRNKNI